MDYHVPAASEVPPIETVHLEFPSPRNPLGVKGLGEGGAVSPPAAIAGAVEDALAPLGVAVTELPVTAPGLFALLQAQGGGRAPGGVGMPPSAEGGAQGGPEERLKLGHLGSSDPGTPFARSSSA